MSIYQDKLNKILRVLMSMSRNIYEANPKTPHITKQSLEIEAYLISKLTDDEIVGFIKVLNKLYKLDDKPSLLDDIININTINPLFERINFILYEQLQLNSQRIDDSLTLKLSIALKEMFTCCNEFELNLRKVYFYLLEKHLESSNGMSEEYLRYLKNVIKILKFKYPDVWFKSISTPLHTYEKENICASYLHQKIEEVIKCILKYKDEELEIDIIYAKVISLQIYLRSLLLILNNEYEMVSYEELYNKLEPNETMAKQIIRNAFIANYIDNCEYTLTKKGE